MGSLTEYFTFLNENPRFLADTVKTFTHITITEKHKENRSLLKYYKQDEPESLKLEL